MLVDLALPALLLAASTREVVTGRNWRNLPILGALCLLLLGNGLTHLEALSLVATAGLGIRIGLATLLGLIGLIGGRRCRASPATVWRAEARRPCRPLSAPSTVGARARGRGPDRVDPRRELGGDITAGAGRRPRHAFRQCRWRPHRIGREPIFLSMHLGYAWLALGLVLLGTVGVADRLPLSAALHALGAGAVGTMILAVMCRTSLAHTGRLPVGNTGTAIAFLALTLAAALRVTAELMPASIFLAACRRRCLDHQLHSLRADLYAGPGNGESNAALGSTRLMAETAVLAVDADAVCAFVNDQLDAAVHATPPGHGIQGSLPQLTPPASRRDRRVKEESMANRPVREMIEREPGRMRATLGDGARPPCEAMTGNRCGSILVMEGAASRSASSPSVTC